MAQAFANYTHLNANAANTVIKAAPGQLTAIVINSKGATGNTISLFDDVSASSGTIAVIDSTSAVGTLLYDLVFQKGLNITIATGTAADITVVWS